MKRPRRGAWPVYAGLVAVLVTAFTSPAHAAGPRLTRAAATSPATVLDKTVTVSCPHGTVAYSTGASVEPPAIGRVVIDRIEPLWDRSGVEVSAKGIGVESAWQLTAYAVCAPHDRRLAHLDSNPLVQSSHTASCPVGTSLTGIGGKIVQPTGNEGLTALEPNAALTKGTASAIGPAGNWSVLATAMCANMAGLKLVQNSATTTATVGCGPGYQVLGSGGKVTNGPNTMNTLLAIEPNAALTAVTASADFDDGAGRWVVTAYAICVPD